MKPALTCVGLGVLLLLAGGTFDAEPLYVGGAAFTLLGVLPVLWVLLGGQGIRVERAIGAASVVEDDRVPVRVVVHGGPAGLPTGWLDEPLLREPVALKVGRQSMRLRIETRFARRGRRVLVPPRVVVRDPLGLAERVLGARVPPPELSVLVLPRVFAVTAAGGGEDAGALAARAGLPRAAAETELDGVRPARPGSPASRMHWSIFARTDELWERRMVADADSRPLVVLDPRAADGEEGALALDAAVRAVASLVVGLMKSGGCALLLPGDRRPVRLESSQSWQRAHIRLALVGPGAPPSAAAIGTRSGPVFYVAARPLRRMPRALEQAPSGAAPRTLVVPGTLPGRRAVLAVAGCTGYAVTAGRIAART